MRMYREEKSKLMNSAQSTDCLPQVVGMTATLGAGKKSRTIDDAVAHGMTILANLNAESITMVEEEHDSLATYLNIPEEMSPVYVERREEDPIADWITVLMTEIENEMERLPGYDLIPMASTVSPKDKKEYLKWVNTAIDKNCPEMVTDGNDRLQLIVCLEYLQIYHRALGINRDVRSKDACMFLRKQFDEMSKQRDNFTNLHFKFDQSFFQSIKEKEKIAKLLEYRNPLLVKMEQLLAVDFEENQRSKALLFTETRDSTILLKKWIEESPKLKCLLRPCQMTGETCESDRKLILEKFEGRSYNILIVTRVAEEGINIAACNLAYRLNYIPSDCGRIQQKGRVRAKDGKSYLVCYGNMKIIEETAKLMERLMANGVKEINEMPKEEFMRQLEKYQKVDKRLAEEEARRRCLEDQSRDCKEYLLCCKKCGQEACLSFDIKRYNKSQHYVCTQGFCTEKIELRPHDKPKKIDKLLKMGRVTCNQPKCGKEWGMLARLGSLYVPVIKIKSFVVYELKADHTRGPAIMPGKWNEVPFTLEDVDTIEEELTFDVDFETWEFEL